MPRFYTFKSADEEKRLLRVRVKTLERARVAQKNRADKLEEKVKDLERENEKLQEELEKAKKQRDTYKDMVFKSNIPFAKQSKKRKRGGQKGHQGYGRKVLPVIDQYEQCHASFCPDCQSPLKRTTSIVTHTVTDIPAFTETKPITTQYQIERQWCVNCHKEVRDNPSGVIPGSRLGINVLTIVLVWHYRMRLPFAKICEQLSFLYGISVSVGSLAHMVKKAREFLGHDYEKVLQEVRGSPVIHADETSWRVEGQTYWCWTAATNEATVYRIDDSRGKGIAQKLLANARGVLVRDDYGAYTNLPLVQQSCWAHLLRKSHEEVARDSASEEIKRLHAKLKDLFALLSEDLAHPFNKKERQEWYLWYKQDIEKIATTPYQASDAKRIQVRIKNQTTNLLTALLYEGVPLTNNLAERAIRPMVVTRKISGGSKTETGAATHAVNMSIIETICKKKQPLLQTLQASLLQGAADNN